MEITLTIDADDLVAKWDEQYITDMFAEELRHQIRDKVATTLRGDTQFHAALAEIEAHYVRALTKGLEPTDG